MLDYRRSWLRNNQQRYFRRGTAMIEPYNFTWASNFLKFGKRNNIIHPIESPTEVKEKQNSNLPQFDSIFYFIGEFHQRSLYVVVLPKSRFYVSYRFSDSRYPAKCLDMVFSKILEDANNRERYVITQRNWVLIHSYRPSYPHHDQYKC